MDKSKRDFTNQSSTDSPQKPSQKRLKLDEETDESPSPASPGTSGCEVLGSEPPAWFACFVQRFDAFEEKVERILSSRLGELNLKLNEHNDHLNSLDHECAVVKKDVEKLREENAVLRASLDDLENRSRRNNLVFYGVPEAGGEVEDCRHTLSKMLQEHVRLDASAFSLERVHRTPTFIQSGKTKKKLPRMIHACFSSYTQKQKVKSECLKHFKEEYEGHKLAVSDDLSKRIRSLRKERMERMIKTLREAKKRPFFLYPAKLAYKELSTGKLIIV